MLNVDIFEWDDIPVLIVHIREKKEIYISEYDQPVSTGSDLNSIFHDVVCAYCHLKSIEDPHSYRFIETYPYDDLLSSDRNVMNMQYCYDCILDRSLFRFSVQDYLATKSIYMRYDFRINTRTRPYFITTKIKTLIKDCIALTHLHKH